MTDLCTCGHEAHAGGECREVMGEGSTHWYCRCPLDMRPPEEASERPDAPEIADLLRRLRALARSEHMDLSIGEEAADMIERLQAGASAQPRNGSIGRDGACAYPEQPPVMSKSRMKRLAALGAKCPACGYPDADRRQLVDPQAGAGGESQPCRTYTQDELEQAKVDSYLSGYKNGESDAQHRSHPVGAAGAGVVREWEVRWLAGMATWKSIEDATREHNAVVARVRELERKNDLLCGAIEKLDVEVERLRTKVKLVEGERAVAAAANAPLMAEVERLRHELTWKLAAIQILASGNEPDIVSEFPAATDVRCLHGEVRRLRARLALAEAVCEAAQDIKHYDGDISLCAHIDHTFHSAQRYTQDCPLCTALDAYDTGRKP